MREDLDPGADWMSSARCRDMHPEVFFPQDSKGVDRARVVCLRCPVREACLEYALEHRIVHGVWGAASERERVRILRARRIRPRAPL